MGVGHPCRSHIMSSFWQVPIPGPRVDVNVDSTCGDAELFSRVFSPMGHLSLDCLGDLWHDAACLNSLEQGAQCWPLIVPISQASRLGTT